MHWCDGWCAMKVILRGFASLVRLPAQLDDASDFNFFENEFGMGSAVS